ncbi:hypothetical protein BFW01_g10731 [Lasiodiplodia theobromae]|uniref:Ig-like domain-containing protein n=2 Tax=Lasiodiplodia theobromae TaxID=45133 RepID=A0A5N5DV57_9PEZI|nr:hypothetical protein DBV05_g200 [Lasiodiplodia theobromae]KAF9629528.1 hypothetical protein BFW01_g10731 [Lasiodiplodia theobromae]
MRFLAASLASLSWASMVYAAVESFALDGLMDAASVSGTDTNSGGSISVNGYAVTVPKNMIVQFPAAWIPWKDVATDDKLNGYEVSVTGNVVNGVAIAGQIQISQTLLNAGTGVIEKVNIGSNSFKVVGGPTVVLNDPNGVYSNGYPDNPAFTADDENPSITAFSGFPMCIPRSQTDPLCPLTNRPGSTNPGASTFAAIDPLVMAPFIPGDYVEWSGITVGGIVYAYAIVASNVQITTDGSKGQPVYIRMEDAIIGVVDPTTGVAANNEFGDTRFIGYTSDSNNAVAAVTINAIDVDPCTGEETNRLVGSASLKAGDVRNKFTWRADSTVATKYTREYRIITAGGIKNTTNGILAGQYVQPVTEWIFPEPTVPGIKPPALNFNVFNNLANGIFQDDFKFGQLSPWPGASAPSVAACAAPKPTSAAAASAVTPKVNVGTPATTIPGALVTLAAKDDSGNNPSILTYSWTQVDGPSVSLAPSQVTAASLSFTAPAQATATPQVKRVFKCTISTGSGTSALSASANATITTDATLADTVVIDTYTWTTQQGGTINVVAHTNVLWDQTTTPAGPKFTLQFGTAAGTGFANSGITGVYQGGGKWSFGARSTKQPGSIKVVSDRKGTAQLTSTTTRKRSAGGSAKLRSKLDKADKDAEGSV